MTATALRKAARYLVEVVGRSERRACELLGLRRSTLRYQARRRPDQRVRERLLELARLRPRYGYRRLWRLLRREGFEVNHKAVYRLYRLEGLLVRKRKRKRIAATARLRAAPPNRLNERWSMDFMQDTLADGRVFRTLNLVDDLSRECLAIEVDFSIPGLRVARVLGRVASQRGYPERIVVDNGPEFVGRVLDEWAYRNDVHLDFIRPGRPMDNGYIESFNGKFRDECLNQHWFTTLEDARRTIEEWRKEYNQDRPHSSLGGLPPAEWAARCGSLQVPPAPSGRHAQEVRTGSGLSQ